MTTKTLEQTSKFLSYVLRHKPEQIGITLDKDGWTNVAFLLKAATNAGTYLTWQILLEIVETDEKGRYSFNEDQTLIRANQGHSSEQVDVQFEEAVPPLRLYHGTAQKNVPAISREGITGGSRHYVHLSDKYATAEEVGARHGTPVVLTIDTGMMRYFNIKFYKSPNGVWLVKDTIEPRFIREFQHG